MSESIRASTRAALARGTAAAITRPSRVDMVKRMTAIYAPVVADLTARLAAAEQIIAAQRAEIAKLRSFGHFSTSDAHGNCRTCGANEGQETYHDGIHWQCTDTVACRERVRRRFDRNYQRMARATYLGDLIRVLELRKEQVARGDA